MAMLITSTAVRDLLGTASPMLTLPDTVRGRGTPCVQSGYIDGSECTHRPPMGWLSAMQDGVDADGIRTIQYSLPGITRPKPKSSHAVADIAHMLVLQANGQRWAWTGKEAWEAPGHPF